MDFGCQSTCKNHLLAAFPFVLISTKYLHWDFPGGPVDKNPPVNGGYMDSIPGPGASHIPQSSQGAVRRNC